MAVRASVNVKKLIKFNIKKSRTISQKVLEEIKIQIQTKTDFKNADFPKKPT